MRVRKQIRKQSKPPRARAAVDANRQDYAARRASPAQLAINRATGEAEAAKFEGVKLLARSFHFRAYYRLLGKDYYIS